MSARSAWPVALTIAGSDSGGAAGAQADLKTFLACRVHGACALTAVTVQNSVGVRDVHVVPAGVVAAQLRCVAEDLGVDAAKTGMLADAAIVEAVADTVADLAIDRFVVDPVCVSQHGHPLLSDAAVHAIRNRLFPLAVVVTPNLYEVAVLTGVEVRDEAGMRTAARALFDLGPRHVLVKGGHLGGAEAVDVLYDGREFVELRAPRVPTVHVHGSGDALASAVTAALARGADLPTAVAEAKAYVTRAVADGYAAGAGRGPVGHFWRVRGWPPADPRPTNLSGHHT